RFAGVDCDPDVQLTRLIAHPVTNFDRGAYRAFGVVLVSGRRAEEGHHGIADELLHGGSESLELVTEALVVRLKQRANVLGIHLVRALGEADEIGEQNGDRLPLLSSRLHDNEVRAAGITEP